MLLSKQDRHLKGAAITRKPIQCPRCKAELSVDVIHYLDCSTEAVRLLTLLFEQAYYKIDCDRCGASLNADWFPVVVDVSDVGLLVFATPGVDDGGVEEGFQHYTAPLLSHLDHDDQVRFRQSPFTIVYGAPGLAAILDSLGVLPASGSSRLYSAGRNWRVRRAWGNAEGVPDVWNISAEELPGSSDLEVSIGEDGALPIRLLHVADHQAAFELADGYLYGNLFFFYPKQRTIQPVVHAFLQMSKSAPDRDARELIYSTFAKGALADTDHPWVLHELGRLAIEADHCAAASFLERALAARHTWLAVTASTLDATPRRREQDEVPAPELSAADVRALGRRIDWQRHTLIRMFPAASDYGRWYFPFSESFSTYSAPTLGTIYGHSVSRLETLIRERNIGWASAAGFDWHKAVEMALGYLSEEDFASAFWREYLSAWPALPRTAARERLTAALQERRTRTVTEDDALVRLWTAAQGQL